MIDRIPLAPRAPRPTKLTTGMPRQDGSPVATITPGYQGIMETAIRHPQPQPATRDHVSRSAVGGPFAHTSDHRAWEPLFTPFGESLETECQGGDGSPCRKCEALDPGHGHLNKVAWWTAKFAAEMFAPGPDRDAARRWGYVAGLWHDLGKFSERFQGYLSQANSDPHSGETNAFVDHSTAGAQYADETIPLFGRLLAYLIGGHHAGLTDGIEDSDSSLEMRLRKAIPAFGSAPLEILEFTNQLPPVPFALKDGISLAYFLRLLFSALVDADFLATEAFMSPAAAADRPGPQAGTLQLEETLRSHHADLARNVPDTQLNQIRADILSHCLHAAESSPGLFSLTVPTGGGKTLSSLAFALKHARLHDLRRVIYVIPYTSIIEQNAAVFRKALAALGPDVVIEHHSNLDPDSEHETTRTRLSTENWDARLIVTTNVQFFESLHASRTSRCRKLHRLARSVIILDEAQALPLDFLSPCLRSIEQLTTHYHSTFVLCTATQPAIIRNADFAIGLQPPREIVPEPAALYQRLRRARSRRLPGRTSDLQLIELFLHHQQALCIVNTRRHAREIFDLLPRDGSAFHLSALMCAEHRTSKLAGIRSRLEAGLPVRLISTQLIEAGVDIDFPVVFRALAGLDSIAQAAGRCDREGMLTATQGHPGGQLFIFQPEALPPAGFLRSTADSGAEVLAGNPPDPLHPDCITAYFRTHYWKNNDATDSKHILDCWPRTMASVDDLLLFRFKTCAREFRLIDDGYSAPVLIPYGERGKSLCSQLRGTFDPREIRILARRLQRYIVTIPRDQHTRLIQAGILLPLHDNQFHLLHSDPHYSEDFGLHPEPDLKLNFEQSIC